MNMLIFLLAISFFIATPSADAAPVCPIAKLYTGSNCTLCTHIATNGKESIATLTKAGRLEVIIVDRTSDNSEIVEFSDLQVLDKDTKKMLALYQDDALSILAKLDELAKQEECNTLDIASTRSLPNQLSARGISSPTINSISDAVSSFFNRVGTIFMSIITFMVK